MDLDGDGIISSYELSYFWEEQEKRYDDFCWTLSLSG
jgi:hypothetical protein